MHLREKSPRRQGQTQAWPGFNNLLRVHPDRRIDVVAPEATTDYFLQRVEKVFGTTASQYSHCKVQGLDCRQARKVRLIAARADQVDIAKPLGVV